jgi:hypothetical protein
VQSDFGYPYIFLRNVLPTDSCYYVNGIITDTTNQQFAIANLFIKIDLNGGVTIIKKLSNPQKTYETWWGGLHNTHDGNLISCGFTYDSIEKALIIVYNTSGDTLFTKEYLSPYYPNDSFITAVAIEPSLNDTYQLLGMCNPQAGTAEGNLYVRKIDEFGNVLQEKIYGNSSTEIPGSLIIEPDGSLIVGSCKTNSNQVLKGFYRRVYILETDSLGNILWEYQSPTGQLWDIAHSMVKTSDGGLAIASGRGIEHPINAEQSQLRWNSYIFKLNANHQFVWGREFRGTRPSGGTYLREILPSQDGIGYVAYGTVGEDKSDGIERFGSWIIKVSNQGDSLWARYYTIFDGHDRSPDPADFKATPDGGYIVVGNTGEGTLDFGWIMKLDSFGCLIPGCNANDGPNATKEAKPSFKLAIYPNPATDFLNFELRTQRLLPHATFRIVDAGGRVVKEYKTETPGDTFIVPVRDWAAGAYFLQYFADGEVRATERFVVMKR